MNKTDLHLHTNFSDGRLSPSALIKLCAENRYTTVSITDHDTIEGYLAAKEDAQKENIDLIPGVEVSSFHNGAEVHILVYYFDENNSELLELLDFINKSRLNRAKKILFNLKSVGINIDFDYLYTKIGKSGIVGRAHIAREIMKAAPNLTVNDIFDKYLNENSPIFEPKLTVNVGEIIPLLNRTGGITALAHPHRLRNVSLVHEIINLGIEGIEVYCPKSATYFINLFDKIARDKGLLITGGSDFHYEPYEVDEFGSFSLPEQYLDNLNEYKDQKVVEQNILSKRREN